jgi:hypothetical protein
MLKQAHEQPYGKNIKGADMDIAFLIANFIALSFIFAVDIRQNRKKNGS